MARTKKVVQLKNDVTREVVSLPLNQLVVSERNVRTIETDVSPLAQSILLNGLYTPLLVIPSKDSSYEVVAGGRRLRALNLLLEQGKISERYAVNVIEINQEDAENASLIENYHREKMHPIDKFMAFRRLAEMGKTALQIADEFGTSELDVKRMMKLSTATGEVLLEFKQGNMELEQLMVLCQVDDPKRQNDLWFSTPEGWQRSASQLKSRINEDKVQVSDRRVKFITVGVYTKAGGRIDVDLFSKDAKEGTIVDVDLLDDLVHQKSLSIADKIKSEGWGWVEFSAMDSWEYRDTMKQIYQDDRALTKTEEKKIEALRKEAAETESKMDALPSDEDGELSDETEDLYSELRDLVWSLEEKIEEIEANAKVWPKDLQSKAGVFICISHNGEIERYDGLVKPDDAKELLKERKTSGEAIEAPTAPAISNSLSETLTAYKNNAVQTRMARQPLLALAVLVNRMAINTLSVYNLEYGNGTVGVDVKKVGVGQYVPGYEETELCLEREALDSYWSNLVPKDASDLLVWLQKQELDMVLALLAYCTSLTVGVSPYGHDNYQTYATLFGVDMNEFWKPTAENYFNRVSKDHMLDVAKEADVDLSELNIAKLKKKELAKEVGERVSQTNWLPEQMKAVKL